MTVTTEIIGDGVIVGVGAPVEVSEKNSLVVAEVCVVDGSSVLVGVSVSEVVVASDVSLVLSAVETASVEDVVGSSVVDTAGDVDVDEVEDEEVEVEVAEVVARVEDCCVVDDVAAAVLDGSESWMYPYRPSAALPQGSEGNPGHSSLQSSTDVVEDGMTFEHQQLLSWRMAKA